LGVAVAAVMSGTAMAQDADKGAFALEKKVVTTQKRTESGQDITISVQAFSAKAKDTETVYKLMIGPPLDDCSAALADDTTVGLNYFVIDDMAAYGKYFRGFKSGWNADFVTAGPHYFAYDLESVDSYELGMKSTKMLRIYKC
jgi:outer membrane receptor protein involved in Fe transport